jgi:cytidyltransferase-like protein
MTNNRVALAVMRLQPLHRGHFRIINRMIQDCGTAIVGLGSAQKSREEHDPWTVEERIQMIKNIYGAYDNKGEYLGCRVKIVPLIDLDASTQEEWVDYVLEKMAKLDMPEPTDLYTGSIADAYWYKNNFWDDKISIGDSTQIHFDHYRTDCGVNRNLHIIDRMNNEVPAATDIRAYLSMRTDDWKEWIPAVNHELVESTYPEKFKVPLN